ncbi:MAG: sodium-dependent bicarbonate transport family permease [Halanaerobiaceae bacterium]
MRSTIPDANPSLALTMSLGIVFPFNIMLDFLNMEIHN